MRAVCQFEKRIPPSFCSILAEKSIICLFWKNIVILPPYNGKILTILAVRWDIMEKDIPLLLQESGYSRWH